MISLYIIICAYVFRAGHLLNMKSTWKTIRSSNIPMRPPPFIKNYRKLSNVASRRNSNSKCRAHQFVIQYQMINPGSFQSTKMKAYGKQRPMTYPVQRRKLGSSF